MGSSYMFTILASKSIFLIFGQYYFQEPIVNFSIGQFNTTTEITAIVTTIIPVLPVFNFIIHLDNQFQVTVVITVTKAQQK